MKCNNWPEFKINAMELFVHNPEFRYNVTYAEHKKGVSVSCTDNDIHIEYYTTKHGDLRKIDQLVQWFVEKMASDMNCGEFTDNIQNEIKEEKAKRITIS